MQRAGVNPGKLVENQETNIMNLLKDAFASKEKVKKKTSNFIFKQRKRKTLPILI